MNETSQICLKIESLLDAYHDRELGVSERVPVDQHLKSCPACKDKLDGISQVVSSLQALPRLTLDKDLWLDVPKTSRPTLRPIYIGALGLAAAAALLLVLVPRAPVRQTAMVQPPLARTRVEERLAVVAPSLPVRKEDKIATTPKPVSKPEHRLASTVSREKAYPEAAATSDNLIELAAVNDNGENGSVTESIGLTSDENGVYALEM